MVGRRGDLFYLGLIAFAAGAGWLGLQLFGDGPGRPFRHGDLASLVRELERTPIELIELDFDVFRSSMRFAPIRAQVRHADEMELALVQNRNQLLGTVQTRVRATE